MKKILLIVLAALMAVSCDLLFNRDSDSTPPTNDIAVTAIKTNPAATIGEVIDLDVMVKNPGNLDVKDEIEITLLNRTQGVLIGSQILEDGLARNDSVMLRYQWDTGESLAGDHTIVAAHNLTDDNIANDSLVSVLTMIDPDITDLAIVGINIPEMVNQDETVDVEVTVKNVGNQDINEAFEVLLKDKTITEDIDILTVNEGLASGDSTLLVFSWDTEGASLGVHEIEACHKFADENSANDLLVKEVTVTEALFIDIAVTALSAPATATEGDVITISATVQNVGTLDAGEDFEIRLFDVTENLQLASQTITGGLPLGNTVVVSFNWDTEDVSIGSHTLTVRHNFSDVNNSNDSRTTELTINEVPVTDIAITDVSGPSPVNQGDKVSISVTVENVGNQDVDREIKVTLVDQTDGKTVGTKNISSGLSARQETTLNFDWDTGGASIGNHDLVVSHNINDDEGSNDTDSKTIFVDEPPFFDLAVIAVNGPSSATQGDNVTVSVRLHNLGNRDIDSDITVTLRDETDGEIIGEKDLGGFLAEGATTTISFIWDTDGSSIGNHNLVASHDFDDDEDNNDSRSKSITINEPIFLDIAITNVVAVPSQVRLGDFITIEVTLQNQGNRDVNDPITIRIFDEIDETIIETQTLEFGLEKGGSVMLPFENWDTSTASVGYHTLLITHNFSDDDPSNNTDTIDVLVEDP